MSNAVATVFMIEKAWSDNMENDSDRAFGYEPTGFVSTQEEAERIVESGGILPKEFAWPLSMRGPATRYRFHKLEPFKEKP